MWRNTIRSRKGISLVLTAICLFALIMIAALVVDVSRLYIAKQRAQNVADATAIAGAWLLDGAETGKNDAESQAQLIATSNNSKSPKLKVYKVGSTEEGITVSFPTSVQCEDGSTISVDSGEAIQVDCCVPVIYGLARIAGHTEGKPQATAAVLRPLVSTFSYGFAPWVVADTSIWDMSSDLPVLSTSLGTQHTLKITNPKDKGSFIGPGNFLCVSYPGDKGGDDYRDRITGSKPPVTLTTDTPIDLYTEPGNMNGPTDQGIQNRLSRDTVFKDNATAWSEWLATYDPETGSYTDTPRIVITPIVQDPGGDLSGRKQLTVVGFAAFFIEDYNKKDEQVVGRFLSATTYEDIVRWGFGSFGDETNLLSTIRMVK